MRRVFVLALLALALPIAASASGIDIPNQFGIISISNMAGTWGAGTIGSTTITSDQVQLRSWGATTTGGSMGSVFFQTGTLATGTISGGGTFNGGGAFDVIGVGAWANALTGLKCGGGCALFTGVFQGPVTWTLTSGGSKNLTYTLSGTIYGQLYDGRMITGTTTQNLYSVNEQLLEGVGHSRVGHTNLEVPEPGTLGLLGTGLVGIAGMFRRKLIGA